MSTSFLLTLLGITAPAYAGQEHPGEKQDGTKAQQKSHEQARPQQPRSPQQQAQRPKPEKTRPEQQTQTRQALHSEHRSHAESFPQVSPEQQSAQRSARQQHRAGNWLTNHRTWQERGGYHGYRIPDLRFHEDFGRSHGFRIRGRPFMLDDGYPRFQYGGYWIRLVDPWPEYWGDNWYESDEVYVNYVGDGYYLFNDRYPSAGIAVSISM
jgi:hypothetical protein